MKILYLSHCLPYPPNKGERIRVYYQLEHLAQSHEVHLLALCRNGSTTVPEELAEFCASSEVFPVTPLGAQLRGSFGLVGRRPLTLSFFHSAHLLRRLREIVESGSFDLVVASTSAMVPYARAVDDATPRVLDMVDVDSAKWAQYGRFGRWPMRWVYAMEAQRMRRLEASLEDFSRIVLTTSREVATLRGFAPHLEAEAVRMGVQMLPAGRVVPRADPPSLVFTGQMDYFANVDGVVRFANEVFPRLRARFENLEFVIVGRSPTVRVQELEDLPGVVVTGQVAEVQPFLERATVFVAPLRIAQGLQSKVLEAMASALPVVCSEEVGAGLVDGGFESGRDLIVARNGEAFESGVRRLLENADLRYLMSRNAYEQVREAYSREAAMLEFERILMEAATGKPAAKRTVLPRRDERIA